MHKLYFKFGVMGCSKSAQALMCKFNYEQKGFKTLLLKPSVDTRSDKDGKTFVRSRIGLSCEAYSFSKDENLFDLYKKQSQKSDIKAIIVDECQFCTKEQIEQLKDVCDYVPVFCYGLKTNFKSELFEGSKRLLEIADSLTELKSICKCGRKAIINALVVDGKVVTEGSTIKIGGDECFESMCYKCWKEKQKM